MVGVAQLVEHQVVALVVEGSIPFTHPNLRFTRRFFYWATFSRAKK